MVRAMHVTMPVLVLIRIVCAGKNNDAYFDGLTDLKFTLQERNAREKKWIEQVKSSGNHLYIKSKRKGDKDVARDFLQRGYEAYAGNLVAGKTGSNFRDEWTPGKLNFFIGGHFEFKIAEHSAKCYGIRVGQGHIWTKNNWWIAGRTNGAQPCEIEYATKGKPGSGVKCGCKCTPPGASGTVDCDISFRTTGKANRFNVVLDKDSMDPVRLKALGVARLYDVMLPSLAHQPGFGSTLAVGGCVFAITGLLVGLVRKKLSKVKDSQPSDNSGDLVPSLLEETLE